MTSLKLRSIQVRLLPVLLIAISCSGYSQSKASTGSHRLTGSVHAYVFVSPNTSTGMSFDEATRSLNSTPELNLMTEADMLLCRLRIRGRVAPVLGSWTDGVENSILIETTTSDQKTRYLSAVLGRDAKQKSVLYFESQPRGPNLLYVMNLPRKSVNLRAVAEILESSGVHFRTLSHKNIQTIVYVADLGGGMSASIKSAARRLHARTIVWRGVGAFLGNDSDAGAARDVFSRAINEFEATHKFAARKCPKQKSQRLKAGHPHLYIAMLLSSGRMEML